LLEIKEIVTERKKKLLDFLFVVLEKIYFLLKGKEKD
jgi:hypothetical protein